MNAGSQPYPYLKKHSEKLLIVLQLIPYLYYFYLLETSLPKNLAADSFRYLWENGSLLSFFTNSSFTIRSLYLFTANNIDLIAHIQLAFVAAAQISIYKALSNKSLFKNTLVAAILTLLFASHHCKWLFNFAMSDSLFISLNILFITSLCAIEKNSSTQKKILITIIAAVFIFSRNLAPYIATLTIIITFTLQTFYKKGSLLILTIIIALSFCSLATTSKFDTSTELNASQSIILKIFPDKEKVALFHEKYGMPVGPFIDACRGGNVNAYCFNYQRVQTGSTYTRTYKVTTDDFYFADWIRTEGMKSWQHYLFIYDFKNTLKNFYTGYKEKFTGIFKQTPSEFWGEEYRTPLDSADPFVYLHKAFILLHLNNLIALSMFIVCSLFFYFTTHLKKEFLCLTLFHIGGMALFFIGYFGDISSDRQVYPGILSIYIGQTFFILTTLHMTLVQIPFFHHKAR